MPTLADRLTATAGRPSGFDYLRIGLATAVIAQHTVSVCAGATAADTLFMVPFRGGYGLVLPTFFALSGFLVASSLERNRSLVSFMALRAIRLIPALSVEVVLSAFFLGPLCTILPLQAYFSSNMFREYFLNVLGDIHYYLPGVFSYNPLPDTINAQLWTIPWELKCYTGLAIIAGAGITARRWLLLILVAALHAVAIHHIVHDHPIMGPRVVGSVMVFCFLAGLTLFRFKDKIPWNMQIFLCSAVTTQVLLNIPGGDYVAALPISYCTVYIGLLNPWRAWIVRRGDFSYGLYLYGFPIQQAVVSMGVWTQTPLTNFLLAYPSAFVLAVLSWYYVEKPASKLKRIVLSLEEHLIRWPLVRWHSQRVFSGQRKVKVSHTA